MSFCFFMWNCTFSDNENSMVLVYDFYWNSIDIFPSEVLWIRFFFFRFQHLYADKCWEKVFHALLLLPVWQFNAWNHNFSMQLNRTKNLIRLQTYVLCIGIYQFNLLYYTHISKATKFKHTYSTKLKDCKLFHTDFHFIKQNTRIQSNKYVYTMDITVLFHIVNIYMFVVNEWI